MKDYIAWLDGHSVARGTLQEVENKAREVWNSENYRTYEKGPSVLRITRGAKQYFVKSVIWERGKGEKP